MAGTLQSIARVIRTGNLTMVECALRLGMTPEQLENRLSLLERQGYILRQAGMPEGATCSCGHCCASCRTPGSRQIPATITLTEKGERLAGDSNGDSQRGPDHPPHSRNCSENLLICRRVQNLSQDQPDH